MIDKKHVAKQVVDWWCDTSGRAIICDKEVWDHILGDGNDWIVNDNSPKIECDDSYRNYIKYIEPTAPEKLQGFIGNDPMMFVIDRCTDPRCIEVLMGADAIVILT